jgi:hypothetical protein
MWFLGEHLWISGIIQLRPAQFYSHFRAGPRFCFLCRLDLHSHTIHLLRSLTTCLPRGSLSNSQCPAPIPFLSPANDHWHCMELAWTSQSSTAPLELSHAVPSHSGRGQALMPQPSHTEHSSAATSSPHAPSSDHHSSECDTDSLGYVSGLWDGGSGISQQ